MLGFLVMGILAALDASQGQGSSPTPAPTPQPVPIPTSSPVTINFASTQGIAPGFKQVSGGVTPAFTNTGQPAGIGPSGTVTQVQSQAYALPVTVVQVQGAPGVVTPVPVTRSVVVRQIAGGGGAGI